MESPLESAYKVIVNNGYYNYVRTFTPKEDEGYMWTRDPVIEKIKTEIDNAYPNYHSGASLAMMLRMIHTHISQESTMNPTNILPRNV